MTYWNDKVIVITGGSAGFGLVLATCFARQRGKVVVAARDPEGLDQAAQFILDESGYQATPLAADVTNATEVAALVQQTLGRHERIDALVNCAGKSSRGSVFDTPLDEFRQLLELNFLSTVQCTQAFLPHLIDSRGHIINIGSLASKSASKFLGAYPSSKFAVAAYSQQLRLELKERDVHVLLVCPGPIRRDDSGQRYRDRRVPEAAQQPGGGVKLKGIDPAWLAEKVLAAGVNRVPELVVPAKAKLLFAIAQLSPTWGDWILSKMMR